MEHRMQALPSCTTILLRGPSGCAVGGAPRDVRSEMLALYRRSVAQHRYTAPETKWPDEEVV